MRSDRDAIAAQAGDEIHVNVAAVYLPVKIEDVNLQQRLRIHMALREIRRRQKSRAIVMGLILAASALGEDVYKAIDAFLWRLRGGLGVATIGASALFGAVSGSAVASATTMSVVAVPEMKRFDYDSGFAAGTALEGEHRLLRLHLGRPLRRVDGHARTANLPQPRRRPTSRR